MLASDPSITVVVSDMRMPGLSGAQWLSQACSNGHDAVKILLTGYADLASATDAVNNGHVFRFLTKPCPRAELETAIDAAIIHHQLAIAERELLEQTLHGSVKALVNVLALTNPGVFGRTNRIRTHAIQLATTLEMKERWQLEVAAMLMHIGYVAIPDSLVTKIELGHALSDGERRQADWIPEITDQLLADIPRLDEVRGILAAHARPPSIDPSASPKQRLVALGAHVLHVATKLDWLETGGDANPTATLAGCCELDPIVVAGLRTLAARTPAVLKAIPITGLRVGMVFGEDVRLGSGAMIVARGYEVTAGFLERLASFVPGLIEEPLRIIVPA